jgi:LPXTG-motif cell wall-anchored protein
VVEVSSGDQSVVGLSVFGGLAALVVGAMLYRRRKDIAGYISRQRSDETADENFQHEFNRKSGTFSVVNRTVDDGTDSRTVVDDPALLRRQSVQFARTQSQESRATVYHDAVHVEDV